MTIYMLGTVGRDRFDYDMTIYMLSAVYIMIWQFTCRDSSDNKMVLSMLGAVCKNSFTRIFIYIS